MLSVVAGLKLKQYHDIEGGPDLDKTASDGIGGKRGREGKMF